MEKMFSPGDFVIHRLTGEMFLVLDVSYDEVKVRRGAAQKDYEIFFFRPFELKEVSTEQQKGE